MMVLGASRLTGTKHRAEQQQANNRRNLVAKRLLDIFFAILGLVLLAPVMVAVALVLYGLGHMRPIFVQKRVGKDGQLFPIYKFRTIRDGSCRSLSTRPQRYQNAFTQFLRVSGLDELPQLLNVLRGDMSLVGPRPHTLTDHILFAARCPAYETRLIVQPGITGWAQVHGWRGTVQTEDHLQSRIHFDRAYVERCGVLFDLFILLLTVSLPFRAAIKRDKHPRLDERRA
ncbi:MAG: sugar transferase [Thalassospira sp.]|uniref:sugar transferase n=1 Tax=Thalassospira sp. TaxID=1912094 RepID=UPI003A883D3D